MSFILDALKKSENERQQQVPADVATVPASADAPAMPRWLWVLGALLLVNVVVLLGLMTRDDVVPELPASSMTPAAPAAEPTATPSFEDRLSAARRSLPDRSSVAAPPTVEATPGAPVAMPADDSATSVALLPSLAELQLDGSINLPELHVDIHVFSDVVSERFVFINMNKYRERDRLAEGPIVERITRDGVVLSHRGSRFVLPRE